MTILEQLEYSNAKVVVVDWHENVPYMEVESFVCKYCGEPIFQHADGKCLYLPTRYMQGPTTIYGRWDLTQEQVWQVIEKHMDEPNPGGNL